MQALEHSHFRGHTRGVNISNILDYVKKMRGSEGMEEMQEALRPHLPLVSREDFCMNDTECSPVY